MNNLELLAQRIVKWSASQRPNDTVTEVLDRAMDAIKEISEDMQSINPSGLTEKFAAAFMLLFDSAQRAGISPREIREAFMTDQDKKEEELYREMYIMGATGWRVGGDSRIGGEAPMRSKSSSYSSPAKSSSSYDYTPPYIAPDYGSHSSPSHDSGSFGGGDFSGAGASGDW